MTFPIHQNHNLVKLCRTRPVKPKNLQLLSTLRLCLALRKFISEYKIGSGENILQKRKTCSFFLLCCENYAGKLFLVFGLTWKKNIFLEKRNTSQPPTTTWSNHCHHQGKAQPTTNHPKSKSRKGKKLPPLLRYHQNTTTITTVDTQFYNLHLTNRQIFRFVIQNESWCSKWYIMGFDWTTWSKVIIQTIFNDHDLPIR